MIQGVYALWLARNDARDGKRIEEAVKVAKSAIHYLTEWNQVQEAKVSAPKAKEVASWTPPEQGWHKLNVDGATAKGEARGAGGMLIRDHTGAFRGGACFTLPDISCGEAAEVLACRAAVNWAANMGIDRLHLEMDCKGVVQMITSEGKNLSALGCVVEDIKRTLNSFQDSKVTWVRRGANKAAHGLSRFGICSNSSASWPEVPPDCILGCVSDEIAVAVN